MVTILTNKEQKMKTVEDFKRIIDRYYKRDNETHEQYEDFKRQYSFANLKKTFDSLPEIEKKFKLKLPQDYKTFIETDSIWYMNGETDQFGIYDERQIYEFNYIGSHQGNSSIEAMKDFYLFGQDYGEISYFFDPFNKLGYGIDAVWRVNRCSCDKRYFELVAKNFYELAEKFCNKEDDKYERPFENEKTVCEGTAIKDILEKQVETNTDLLNKVNEMHEQIKEYFTIMLDKGIRRARITKNDYDEDKSYKLPETTNIPLDIFCLLEKNMYEISFSSRLSFDTVCGEPLININSGKYSMKILKDMFVFADIAGSIINKEDVFNSDYFFVDPTNKLGRGADAVYIIYTKSKKLEEACYVAKDIVDLFRIFAEGEEINTTPIGKL